MRNRNRPSLSGYFALVLLPLSLSALRFCVDVDSGEAEVGIDRTIDVILWVAIDRADQVANHFLAEIPCG